MCLVLDLGQFTSFGWSVSFSEAADHPATFTKINGSPQGFFIYNKKNGPKLQNTLRICFFCISVNVFSRFSGNEFSQDCSVHHFIKYHVRENDYLLSYGSKSYWPIRLHGFSEFSISLTTWLFGMIFCVMV